MKHFLCKCAFFGFLFWAATSISAALLDSRLVSTGDKVDWIKGLHRMSYGYAFIGSSRVEYTVDAQVVEDYLGESVINLGCSGAGAADNYLELVAFLEDNTVGTVVLQLDHITISDDLSYSFHDFSWLPEIRQFPYAEVIREQRPWRFWMWRLFPISKHTEFHSRYRYGNACYPPLAFRKYEVTKGSSFRDEVFSKKQYGFQSACPVPKHECTKYIEQIVQLCQHKRIEIVLFTAPFYELYDTYIDSRPCQAWIESYATKMGLIYKDFNTLSLRTDKEIFCDINHLNKRGTRVFSLELARFLKRVTDAEHSFNTEGHNSRPLASTRT